jgi:predicted nucleic acid-binding protein
MTHGRDTSFLVAVEVASHEEHAACRARLQKLLKAGDTFSLVPQILAEFIHVVTDPRRFSSPLTQEQAIARAEIWWSAAEVAHVFPTAESTLHFSRLAGGIQAGAQAAARHDARLHAASGRRHFNSHVEPR